MTDRKYRDERMDFVAKLRDLVAQAESNDLRGADISEDLIDVAMCVHTGFSKSYMAEVLKRTVSLES